MLECAVQVNSKYRVCW